MATKPGTVLEDGGRIGQLSSTLRLTSSGATARACCSELEALLVHEHPAEEVTRQPNAFSSFISAAASSRLSSRARCCALRSARTVVLSLLRNRSDVPPDWLIVRSRSPNKPGQVDFASSIPSQTDDSTSVHELVKRNLLQPCASSLLSDSACPLAVFADAVLLVRTLLFHVDQPLSASDVLHALESAVHNTPPTRLHRLSRLSLLSLIADAVCSAHHQQEYASCSHANASAAYEHFPSLQHTLVNGCFDEDTRRADEYGLYSRLRLALSYIAQTDSKALDTPLIPGQMEALKAVHTLHEADELEMALKTMHSTQSDTELFQSCTRCARCLQWEFSGCALAARAAEAACQALTSTHNHRVTQDDRTYDTADGSITECLLTPEVALQELVLNTGVDIARAAITALSDLARCNTHAAHMLAQSRHVCSTLYTAITHFAVEHRVDEVDELSTLVASCARSGACMHADDAGEFYIRLLALAHSGDHTGSVPDACWALQDHQLHQYHKRSVQAKLMRFFSYESTARSASLHGQTFSGVFDPLLAKDGTDAKDAPAQPMSSKAKDPQGMYALQADAPVHSRHRVLGSASQYSAEDLERLKRVVLSANDGGVRRMALSQLYFLSGDQRVAQSLAQESSLYTALINQISLNCMQSEEEVLHKVALLRSLVELGFLHAWLLHCEDRIAAVISAASERAASGSREQFREGVLREIATIVSCLAFKPLFDCGMNSQLLGRAFNTLYCPKCLVADSVHRASSNSKDAEHDFTKHDAVDQVMRQRRGVLESSGVGPDEQGEECLTSLDSARSHEHAEDAIVHAEAAASIGNEWFQEIVHALTQSRLILRVASTKPQSGADYLLWESVACVSFKFGLQENDVGKALFRCALCEIEDEAEAPSKNGERAALSHPLALCQESASACAVRGDELECSWLVELGLHCAYSPERWSDEERLKELVCDEHCTYPCRIRAADLVRSMLSANNIHGSRLLKPVAQHVLEGIALQRKLLHLIRPKDVASDAEYVNAARSLATHRLAIMRSDAVQFLAGGCLVYEDEALASAMDDRECPFVRMQWLRRLLTLASDDVSKINKVVQMLQNNVRCTPLVRGCAAVLRRFADKVAPELLNQQLLPLLVHYDDPTVCNVCELALLKQLRIDVDHALVTVDTICRRAATSELPAAPSNLAAFSLVNTDACNHKTTPPAVAFSAAHQSHVQNATDSAARLLLAVDAAYQPLRREIGLAYSDSKGEHDASAQARAASAAVALCNALLASQRDAHVCDALCILLSNVDECKQAALEAKLPQQLMIDGTPDASSIAIMKHMAYGTSNAANEARAGLAKAGVLKHISTVCAMRMQHGGKNKRSTARSNESEKCKQQAVLELAANMCAGECQEVQAELSAASGERALILVKRAVVARAVRVLRTLATSSGASAAVVRAGAAEAALSEAVKAEKSKNTKRMSQWLELLADITLGSEVGQRKVAELTGGSMLIDLQSIRKASSGSDASSNRVHQAIAALAQ